MTDHERLKGIIDEIDALFEENGSSSPRFKAWRSKTIRFLETKFGEKSRPVKDIEKLHFQSFLFDDTQDMYAYKRDLKTAKAFLQTYLDEFTDEIEEENITKSDFSKIFIVHGHDGELKESVARITEKQGIEAIILSEKANQGRTIIEKFEDYSDVSGAVCLFTADDIGNKKSEAEMNPRARQNVVFEAGFFMGKLGRDHVIILADKNVEIPSDLAGVVYTDTASWQFDLLKELNAMGYTVDANKLF